MLLKYNPFIGFIRGYSKLKKVILSSVLAVAAFGYEPGNGVELTDFLKVGGYVAAKYEKSENTDKLLLDDVAVMAYGNISSSTRYLVEMENVGRYQKDFKNDKESESGAFRIERAVVEHSFSSHLKTAVGKMITPVGYWNQTPINVLRDTTSSPFAATNIFPKLITGVQFFGETGTDDLEYSVCAQHNNDFDEKYNNFAINEFYGTGLTYSVTDYLETKGYVGYFKERNDASKRRFVHLSGKYQKGDIQLLSEAVYSDIDARLKRASSTAAFFQGRYALNQKHYAVARYEFYYDSLEAEREHIGVIGYNYRPIYPVSLKAEYGISSISKNSRFLCSVSALF